MEGHAPVKANYKKIIVIVMWWQIPSTHTKLHFVRAVPKWTNKNRLQWPSMVHPPY